MDKKEIRLNAGKRKSLVIDFRKHCESLDTHEKEAFKQSRDDAKSTIESSFATMKEVVERRFPLEDVATLQSLQRKHNTINAVGFIDKQTIPIQDAWIVQTQWDYTQERGSFKTFYLINRLMGVHQEINREQALKPNTDSDWDTINNPQAKELAVQLGLAS